MQYFNIRLKVGKTYEIIFSKTFMGRFPKINLECQNFIDSQKERKYILWPNIPKYIEWQSEIKYTINIHNNNFLTSNNVRSQKNIRNIIVNNISPTVNVLIHSDGKHLSKNKKSVIN